MKGRLKSRDDADRWIHKLIRIKQEEIRRRDEDMLCAPQSTYSTHKLISGE